MCALRLTYRKTRAAGRRKTRAGTYYIEGTDHTGEPVKQSLRTGDRDLAKRLFAESVAKTLEARLSGPKGIMNFADAVEVYTAAKGENSNLPWLERMLPEIGTRKLAELTQADLNALADKLCAGCAPATKKRLVYTPFIAAYNACVDHEPSLADPRRWKSPKVTRKTVDAPDDGYVQALTDAAAMAGGRTAKGHFTKGSRHPERDEAAILCITMTGCRTGELLHVRRRDVGLEPEPGYVLFRKTKGKDDNPRVSALAPELRDAMRRYLDKLGDVPGDTLLFPFKSRWGLAQMVRRARKRAGLPYYRPHAIGRHAFATRLLSGGASLLDVQKAGGWKSARMVSDVYAHLAKEHVDGIVGAQELRPPKTKKRKKEDDAA